MICLSFLHFDIETPKTNDQKNVMGSPLGRQTHGFFDCVSCTDLVRRSVSKPPSSHWQLHYLVQSSPSIALPSMRVHHFIHSNPFPFLLWDYQHPEKRKSQKKIQEISRNPYLTTNSLLATHTLYHFFFNFLSHPSTSRLPLFMTRVLNTLPEKNTD